MTRDPLLLPAPIDPTAAWRARLARWLIATATRLLADRPATATRAAGPVPRRHVVRRPGTVTVTRGRLWVTIDGDLGDHAVPAGASLPMPAGRVARIGSLDADAAEWHWSDRPTLEPVALPVPPHPERPHR